MSIRYLFAITLLAGLAACGGSEPEAVTIPPQQPAAEVSAPATPSEQFVAGQLESIDPEAMTLVLQDARGTEHTFAFSSSTNVTGVATAANLSAQEGRSATIRYIERDSLKSALQIHVEGGS